MYHHLPPAPPTQASAPTTGADPKIPFGAVPDNGLRPATVTSSNEYLNVRRAPITEKSCDPNFDITLECTPKSEFLRQELGKALRCHFLFKTLTDREIRNIINVMSPMSFGSGDEIIQQGTTGTRFYVLELGKCDIIVDGQLVGSYREGDAFGELALMYNSERAATIRATTPCTLWTLDRTSFRHILITTASSQQVALVQFLRRIPMFRPLSNIQVQKIAAALEYRTYEDKTYIIRQGEAGDSFFIISDGKVLCTSNNADDNGERPLMQLGAGDYFGEMALLLNEPRQANCIAQGKVHCFTLDRHQFTELFGPLRQLLDQQMRIRVLRSVQLLASLSDEELDILVKALHVKAFEDGQSIIRTGEVGSAFYMITEGKVRVLKSSIEVLCMGPGEYFGERALLRNEPRAADCVAQGHVECLVLDRASFEAQLGKLEHIMEREIRRQQAIQEDAFAQHRVPTPVGANTYQAGNLRRVRTIGTGTFGRVYMVQHAPTKETLALKCMQKAVLVESHQQHNVIHEKNILAKCNHPFIMKLLSTYSDPHQIYMLFELVQGGELWTLLYEKYDLVPAGKWGRFDVATSRFYSANVIEIFHYLATLDVAYRDLKPENLLLDNHGYLKMVDFGFAKNIPFRKGHIVSEKSYTLCGTPEYLAPELVLSKGHTKAVDYWALGCLIYEFLIGHTPFQDDVQAKSFEKIIQVNQSLQFPAGFDPEAEDLIRKLLHANPALRLGALAGGVEDIKNHPWFRTGDFSWEALQQKQLAAPYVPPLKDQNDTRHFDSYAEDSSVADYYGPDYFQGF